MLHSHLFRCYAFNRTNLLFLCGNFRTIVVARSFFCSAELKQHEHFVVTTWKMRFYNIYKQYGRYRAAVSGYLMYACSMQYMHVLSILQQAPAVLARLSSRPFDRGCVCVLVARARAAIGSLNRTESDTLSLKIPAKTKKTNKQLTIQTICENQIHAK